MKFQDFEQNSKIFITLTEKYEKVAIDAETKKI